MSAWGDPLFSGTGGTHSGYHPGTPLAHSPLSRSQMGTMWGRSLERDMPKELSRCNPQTTSTSSPSPGCFHLSRKSRASRNPNRPIWLCGVPGCFQQAGSHPPSNSSAMGLCHRLAAWGKSPQGYSIPPVHPGAQGHGGLHPGGS